MSKRRQRIILVCDNCHHRKIKCNKKLPCDTCTSRGIGALCRYSTLEKELVKQGKSTSLLKKESNQELIVLKARLKELEETLSSNNLSSLDSPISDSSPSSNGSYMPIETAHQKLIELRGTEESTDFFASYGSDAFCAKIQETFIFSCPVSFNAIVRRDAAFIVFWHHNYEQKRDTSFRKSMILGVSALLENNDCRLSPSEVDNLTKEYFGANYLPKVEGNDTIDHTLYKTAINGYKSDRAVMFYPNYIPANSNILSRIYYVIPPRDIIFEYVEVFFLFLHGYFPVYEKSSFVNDLEKLLVIGGDEQKLKINIEHNSDIAKLGSLLFMLRFTYLYIVLDNRSSFPSIPNREDLLRNPIYIEAAYLGKECLKEFNIGLGLSFDALQCFVMAKIYKIHGSDDCNTFKDSDLYAGTLVSCATALGLHRDPDIYVHDDLTWLQKTHRRKLWYLTLSIETSESAVYGRFIFNDRFSDVVLGQLNIPGDDTLYQVTSKVYKIRPTLTELLRVLVDIRRPVKLDYLANALTNLEQLLKVTYGSLPDLLAKIVVDDPKPADVLNFQFFLSFELFMIKLYFAAYIIYERKGFAELSFKYYKKMLNKCYIEFKPFTQMFCNKAYNISAPVRMVLTCIYIKCLFINTFTAVTIILHLNYSIKLLPSTEEKPKHYFSLLSNVQLVCLSALHYAGPMSCDYLLAFKAMRMSIFGFRETEGLRTYDGACRGKIASYIFSSDQIHELCELFDLAVVGLKSDSVDCYKIGGQVDWYNFIPYDDNRSAEENITVQRLHLNQRENMWLYYVSETAEKLPSNFKSDEDPLSTNYGSNFLGTDYQLANFDFMGRFSDFLPEDFVLSTSLT